MKVRKHGIFTENYSVSWGIGGSTLNGNGTGYAWIRVNLPFIDKYFTSTAWKIGNGDNGDRTY